MTAQRTTVARYNQTNQSNSNNVLSKRTRGPINKRACQRCRQGKIKCDGDAESGKPCSNCDPQHCKYDNSPRKNKQVESLKLRLTAVEDQLVAITRDVGDKLNTKDLEKEILCLLYETKEHFTSTQNQGLFQALRDALKESRCIRPILAITFELLTRLASAENVKFIPDIMKSLERFVECANSFDKDASIMSAVPSVDMFKKIEEDYFQSGPQAYPTNDNILPVDQSSMIAMQGLTLPLDNTACDQVDIGHLNLHSADDDSSETHSRDSRGGYEFNDDSPSTPPERQNQHQHQHQHQQQRQAVPETKCFNSNNVTHHIQGQSTMMTGTSTAPEYSLFGGVSVGSVGVGGDVYNTYYQNPEYNYATYGFLVNEHTTTTSPTDEPPMNSS